MICLPASQQRVPEKNQEVPVTGRFSRKINNHQWWYVMRLCDDCSSDSSHISSHYWKRSLLDYFLFWDSHLALPLSAWGGFPTQTFLSWIHPCLMIAVHICAYVHISILPATHINKIETSQDEPSSRNNAQLKGSMRFHVRIHKVLKSYRDTQVEQSPPKVSPQLEAVSIKSCTRFWGQGPFPKQWWRRRLNCHWMEIP